MRNSQTQKILLVTALFLPVMAWGQMGSHGSGSHGAMHNGTQSGMSNMMDPHHGGMFDTLQVITVSGVVDVDTTLMMDHYYLDVDGDDSTDYQLMFGPPWYDPGSGAVRPADGDSVSITGGLLEFDTPQGIVVYEINGLFWRDPFDNPWHQGGHHGGGHHGGWYTNLTPIDISGIAFVDTLFMMDHYFIDVDLDDSLDYQLDFGPWWYDPQNGATRPETGDTITIRGGLFERDSLGMIDMVVVWEINGFFWRDSTGPGPWGGGWVHRGGMMGGDTTRIYCPVDSLSWMFFGSGSMSGMMYPDSAHVGLYKMGVWEMPPYYGEDSVMVAGFMTHVFDPEGNDMMNGNGQHGGMGGNGSMGFSESIELKLHYFNSDIFRYGGEKRDIELRAWNEETEEWEAVSGVTGTIVLNTLTFDAQNVRRYYGVFAPVKQTGPVGVEYDGRQPASFSLSNAYPNPFNPVTRLEFTLNESAPVMVDIMNLRGQVIATLIEGSLSAGTHHAIWDGRNSDGIILPSGVYFARLTVDGLIADVRKLTMVK